LIGKLKVVARKFGIEPVYQILEEELNIKKFNEIAKIHGGVKEIPIDQRSFYDGMNDERLDPDISMLDIKNGVKDDWVEKEEVKGRGYQVNFTGDWDEDARIRNEILENARKQLLGKKGNKDVV